MKSAKHVYTLSGEANKNILETVRDVYVLRGMIWSTKYLLVSIMSYMLSPFWNILYRFKYKTYLLSNKTFLFNEKKYSYHFHKYNHTWSNERTIEIPLIKSYLGHYKNARILEVGNVLSYYYKLTHDVVDNYEIAKGVINKDIMQFKPKDMYDVVFSISTIEHIGLDGIREQKKAVKTIALLRKYLAPNGMLLFTIPLGYNHNLDESILNGKMNLTQTYFFKKVSSSNKWIQIKKENVSRFHYGFPFRWGNIIVLGIVKNRK